MENGSRLRVVIIGAGLAGLSSAILLGRLGIQVTVVERSSLPGGLLRSYRRRGVDCPVGLHYFGPAGEGELLRQMFDLLGVTTGLRLRPLGGGGILERYIFDDLTFDLPPTLAALGHALSAHCPGDERAIAKVVAVLADMCRGLRLGKDGQLLSNPFAAGGVDRSLQEFLFEAGCSTQLRRILSVHGFWAGVPMDRCPAYLVLATLASLLQSAWELGCTGAEMADLYAERAREVGVRVLCGDAVEEIVVLQGRASGVRLCSGETLSCDKVVAAIHPKLVLAMLPEETLPRDYRLGLLALPETSGAVMVHTLLPCHRHQPPGFNIFRIRHDKDMHVDGIFLQLRESHVPGYSHLTLIGGSPYQDWQRWHHSRSGARGPDYMAAKEEVAERMLGVAATVLGPLDGRLPVDISTPLTLRDWAASPQGSLYGLERSVPSDLRYAVLTRMPVRSMVLVGQNAIAPGLLGVTFGVLRGVGEVVGRARFRAFLASDLSDGH